LFFCSAACFVIALLFVLSADVRIGLLLCCLLFCLGSFWCGFLCCDLALGVVGLSGFPVLYGLYCLYFSCLAYKYSLCFVLPLNKILAVKKKKSFLYVLAFCLKLFRDLLVVLMAIGK
jgi:hypothetical protein